jgi:hypothetical protein
VTKITRVAVKRDLGLLLADVPREQALAPPLDVPVSLQLEPSGVRLMAPWRSLRHCEIMPNLPGGGPFARDASMSFYRTVILTARPFPGDGDAQTTLGRLADDVLTAAAEPDWPPPGSGRA